LTVTAAEAKDIIQHLNYFNLLPEAQGLNSEMQAFYKTVNIHVKSFAQQEFETQHPELGKLYPDVVEFDRQQAGGKLKVSLSNFDLLFKPQ